MDTFLLLFACLCGFFMAWGVGANDVANAMGTSVGSKALTLKQAVIIAAVFEAGGAILAGSQVTDTIRGHIISPDLFQSTPNILVLGMLAALLASGLWLAIATYLSLPVSTTHTIVGAILGFGIYQVNIEAVDWTVVINIVLSWIVTPFISGILAYGLTRWVQRLIFDKQDKIIQAKRWIPVFIFLTAFIVSFITLAKGVKHVVQIDLAWQLMYSIGFSLALAVSGFYLLHRVKFRAHDASTHVERLFARLMIFTASAMAFAHGSNDVANAIGPLAAIVDIVHSSQEVKMNNAVPFWVLLIGAAGIVVGLISYGYRVIATVGEKITELTPSRGFAVEIATASTVVMASGIGLPVSTTQTLVGAVLGVGFARGISAIRLQVVGNIFISWLVTLPVGALFAIAFYELLCWFIPIY